MITDMAFTVVDFSGGVLGLAWVASAAETSAGICTVSREFAGSNEEIWYNTAIVTYMNYRVSYITVLYWFDYILHSCYIC